MKKILFVIFCTLASLAKAQQVPTGLGSQTINQNWSRNGNTGNGSTPTNANIFGTAWNSPIYTITNGVVRTRLNGSLLAGINGVLNHDVTGYFGIGLNNFFATETPLAMLHIEGPNNTNPIQTGFGWRTWMRTGVFMKENSDAMYVGLQQQAGTNRSDAVINWSDDYQDIWGGADRLKIVMTAPAAGNGSNTLATDGNSLLGYEFMQFVVSDYQINDDRFPTGFVGIGPVFTNTRPQSRLHINSEGNLETWFQISSQTGTGQTQNDGFRLGITSNGTANFRQQENQPIIFYTNWDNLTSVITNGERIRVTAVGQAGVPNPNNIFPINTTRFAISHNGANPITQPRSLLHLGYNTGSFSSYGADGWRTWMDIGMFASDGTDNVYLGLKKTAVTDRTDAVLSWGDNQPAQTPDGPDNLLFVFTATNTAVVPSTGQAATVDGVESMRMSPTATGVNVGIGGNPSTNYYFNNSVNPTQTLEVNSSATAVGATNSGLRFTDLRSSATPIPNDPSSGFLTVNSTGDVVYMAQNIPTGGSNNAENGCSINTNNNVVLGNNVGAVTARFISHREVPMFKYNLLFSEEGRIGIGDHFTAGANSPISKLDIHSDTDNPLALNVESNLNYQLPTPPCPFYVLSKFINNTSITEENISIDVVSSGLVKKRATGIQINVNNTTPSSNIYNHNIGIISSAINGNGYNTGGAFYAEDYSKYANTGVTGYGADSEDRNYGGFFRAGDPNYNFGNRNYGIYAEGAGGNDCFGVFAIATGGSNNYGIFAEALPTSNSNPPTGPNYAGFFNGDVVRTGSDNFTSDANLKENVQNINDATGIINILQSHTFTYKTSDYPQIGLPHGLQYGLIAQEVETILPNLVKNVVYPAKYDSLGNVVIPSVEFKTLNYTGFIPILIQAVQEINTKNDSAVLVLNNRIDSLQNVISTFESRFNELSERIEECCKNGNGHGNGHGNNKSNGNNNGDDESNSTINANLTEITLENSESIILEQNVPNPFAESTTINYYIPENINYAQVVFSNNFGKIIKTVDITTSGKGTIKVFASNLSSGTYSYSLIVDGKIVESKKMVCVK